MGSEQFDPFTERVFNEMAEASDTFIAEAEENDGAVGYDTMRKVQRAAARTMRLMALETPRWRFWTRRRYLRMAEELDRRAAASDPFKAGA